MHQGFSSLVLGPKYLVSAPEYDSTGNFEGPGLGCFVDDRSDSPVDAAMLPMKIAILKYPPTNIIDLDVEDQ